MTSASASGAADATGSAEAAAPAQRVGVRRIATGLVLAAVGFGALVWAPGFTLLVLLIATGCLYEFAGIVARKGPVMELPVALAAVWTYVLLTHLGLVHRYEGILLATTVVAALGVATFTAESGYLARSGYTLLGVLYIGKLLTYFIAIRSLHDGVMWTAWAIVLIAFTDIFSMLVGTAIGRTRLTRLSPHKTVEGAVGGFAFTLAAGAAMTFIPAAQLSWWQGAIVGAIVSIAAQAGDLVESALKRDASVKDAGSFIGGGHGGVLDRFDSYIFGGVAFYFALFLIGVINENRLTS